MNGFTAKHALVTGGGRGIGRAIAVAMTAAGVAVTVTGRSEAPLREAVQQKDAAGYFIADVTDEGALADGIKRAAAERGAIDILVANAGGAESAPFAKSGADMFRRMIDLNLMGTVYAAQAVIADMSARKFGRIVVVASTAGLKGYAYVSAYCAAKHGLVGLTRALAVELAQTGVAVSAVCPGFTDTDLVPRSVETLVAKTGRTPEAARAGLARGNPQGRLVTPDEVASAIAWL